MTPDRAVPIPALPPRLMLGFLDPELERQFVSYYTNFYYHFAQASLVLGLLLVIGDFAVDFLAFPQVSANYYRLSVCAPILMVVLGYSFHSHAKRYWEPVMSALIVVIAMAMFWVLLRIDAQGGQGLDSWVGVLNFTILEFYCFVILGARFSHALPSGLLILVGFEWAMYQGLDGKFQQVSYLSYHTVTMTVIAAGIGWWREFLLRKNFASEVILRRTSERREFDQSLAEATLEASSNGILVVNLEGTITSTNHRFTEMWNIPDVLIAMGDDSKVLQFALGQLKDPQQFLRKVEDLYIRPEAKSRDRLVFHDGRVFERFSHPQRLRREIVGRVWSFLDVTDQVRAEERVLQLTQAVTDELDRSEHQRGQLQALLEAIPDRVWMKDPHGAFISCNPAFEKLMGRPAAELLGKTDYDFAAPGVADVFHASDLAAIQSSVPIVFEKWVADKSSGHEVLHETTKVAVRDMHGILIGVLGITRDVTGIRVLMDELREAKDEAQRASVSKSLFLANMSHEIRTPMNAIIGMADLVLNTELDARQRNYVNKVKIASDGLMYIINDILDFSKIEAGKMQMECIPFELDDVFERLSSLLALRAESQGIELAYKVADGIPAVLMGDALRLGQILTNLVSNALKFSSGGNVIVSVESTKADEGSSELHFSVSDEGIGMTDAQIAQMFQPFVQADASTTRQFGGTGLGLAICRHLVGLLKGRIWVNSEAGVGSTFQFTGRFRHGVERRHQNTSEFAIKLAQYAHQQVLIVDDNPVARQVLQHLVGQIGLDVVAMESGEAAVAMMQEPEAPKFLVCLIDWFMPHTDGIDTIAQLRLASTASGAVAPPMILVTAHSQDEALRRIIHNVDGLLTKPVSTRNLYEEIARCLGLKDVLRPRAGWRINDELQWSRFHGLDILVVDDVEVNREVMTELLGGVGLSVRLANDGAEALAAVSRKKPDLILMDCHMPVMDGYTATRQIRTHPAYADIAIIALTASAMANDKRRCLACGMNGYVAKPVRLAQLYAQMTQCLPELASVPETWVDKGAATGASLPGTRLPSFPGIDFALGLSQVGGRVPLLLRVLKKFRDNLGKMFESQFNAAMDLQDWATAERLAHSLKGVSRTLGASDLAECSEVLESAVEDRNPEMIASRLGSVKQQLRLVCAGLAQLDSLLQDEPVLPVSNTLGPVEWSQLNRLADLLAERDAEAVELAVELTKHMSATSHHSQWRTIAAFIERYEFVLAGAALQQLLGVAEISSSTDKLK